MVSVVAIVPARSGSKSVVDKNVVLLSGFPLIAYSIALAKLSRTIERVVISTDSKRYAKLAIEFGAEVPFLRPTEISGDSAIDREFFLHAIKWFQENEQSIPEYLVHLRPTTPLRIPEIVDRAIHQIIADQSATSLRSAHKSPESPAKWFRKDNNGNFVGLLEEGDDVESFNLPKEEFSDVYIPNGYVDVVRSSHILHNDTLYGRKVLGFETTSCTEVDSQDELAYIQYQLHRQGSPLFNYLNNNCCNRDPT